jgi:hypothetical protein
VEINCTTCKLHVEGELTKQVIEDGSKCCCAEGRVEHNYSCVAMREKQEGCIHWIKKEE